MQAIERRHSASRSHKRLRFAILLALALGSLCNEGSAQIAVVESTPTVLIDPAFGGKDKGPLIEDSYFGKSFTLEIARTITEELTSAKVVSALTRNDDALVPYDDVLLRARAKGVQVRSYVVVSVGETVGNCVRVIHPKSRHQKPPQEKADLVDVLGAVTEDRYLADSKSLANAIRTGVNNQSPKVCVKVISRESYKAGASANLLPRNFVAPLVVLEFEKDLARTLKGNANISAAVAAGIQKFLQANR